MSSEDLRARAMRAVFGPSDGTPVPWWVADIVDAVLAEARNELLIIVKATERPIGDPPDRTGFPSPIHSVWYEPRKLVRALADHISPPQEGNRMSEPIGSKLTTEQQDVTMSATMNADANVQWRNPDALNCEQTIRTHAVGLALNLAGRSFDQPIQAQSVLQDAQAIADYITDGTIPTTAGDPE